MNFSIFTFFLFCKKSFLLLLLLLLWLLHISLLEVLTVGITLNFPFAPFILFQLALSMKLSEKVFS